jgi:hypothetical protein
MFSTKTSDINSRSNQNRVPRNDVRPHCDDLDRPHSKLAKTIKMYLLLAEITLLVHLAFIAFVLGGGLLVLRWPRAAWLHLPAVIWGALIEFTGWICPLTPLEKRFLELAGDKSYQGGFIARYLWPTIYPADLTQAIQVILGAAVIVLNSIVYAFVLLKAKRRPPAS